MKNFLFLTLTGVSFFSLIISTTVHSTETNSESTVETSDDYTEQIIYLEQIHSIQQKIKNLKENNEKLNNEKLRTDLIQQKYNAMEACNVKLLSDVYENPQEAWKNITNEYDEKELKLTVDIVTGTPQKTSTGEDANSEMMANWYLGKEVLQDVYANPEKYGKTKDGKSFELWEDQKFAYAEEVNNFLTGINAITGRTGRIPGISAENDFAKNEAAYQNFLSSLPEDILKKLTPAQKTFPIPPKALPPAHEIMWLNEDPAKSKIVFPEWPDPWKQFIQSGFTTYNPNGEMAKAFLPKTLVLKDEFKHKGVDEINNRLNVYQAIKKEKTGADNVLNIVKKGQQQSVNDLNENLKEMGFNKSIDANDLNSLIEIEKDLVSQKNKNIKIVRDIITKTNSDILETKDKPNTFKDYLKMSYGEQLQQLETLPKNSEEYRMLKQIMFSSQAYQDYHYVNALEKDINGEINFISLDAQNIDHLMKENAAQKALFEKIKEKEKNEIIKNYSKKINDQCLNGGL